MKLRSVLTIAVAVIGISGSTAVYAAPTLTTPVHAMFAKSKLVKLNLHNDSPASMELKVGDDVMTIEAGKTVAVKLPVGTRIVTNAPTANHQAGVLLAQVSSDLSDATLSFK